MQKIESAAKMTWPVVMAWIGGITAVIAFVGSLAGGITWFVNHHKHNLEFQAKMALARTQTNEKQYQAAFHTYEEILKDDPLNRPVLDAQLDAAMMWVENFSVVAREEGNTGDSSAPDLDIIFPVLSSGLTREKGIRRADVEAHLGWAHFLNSKFAQREDDSAAVNDWHDALSTDPANVYANAMLGNWLLQSGGDLTEALPHFQAAANARGALPFVRSLQLGGVLYLDKSGARAETIRIANEMRAGGEPLDPGLRHRIVNWCFDPTITKHRDLIEALSAVSNEDAWKTYLWLDSSSGFDSEAERDLKHSFIQANLLELAGSRDAALSEYRQIQEKLKNRPGSLRDQVGAAIERLTHA